jgi:hypothetical protein
LRTAIVASRTTANQATFATGLRSLIKDPKHKKMIPVLHIKSVAHAPWGIFLNVLDTGLRSGVTHVSIDSTTVPKRGDDLRKLVRDLAKPSPKQPTSFDVRLEGAPVDKDAPIKPAPKVARVIGAFAGYFKPEQFDFEEEVEEAVIEEVEPDEPKPDEPTKKPKPK